MRSKLNPFMKERNCSDCKGTRLRSDVLTVKIDSKNIIEVTELSIASAIDFFNGLTLSGEKATYCRAYT